MSSLGAGSTCLPDGLCCLWKLIAGKGQGSWLQGSVLRSEGRNPIFPWVQAPPPWSPTLTNGFPCVQNLRCLATSPVCQVDRLTLQAVVLVVRSMGFRLTREAKYHPCLFITQEFCAQVGIAAACKQTALATGPIFLLATYNTHS